MMHIASAVITLLAVACPLRSNGAARPVEHMPLYSKLNDNQILKSSGYH
jgi:hypothetical protein